ncbi:MAG: GNAT family N-acetyltransferase [Fidelibacterota bacterium]
MLIVKYINTEEEYRAALEIRKKVFIEEQHVSRDEEIDEFEESATHIIALWGEKIMGTARWRFTPEGVKLERFAVLKSFRRQGIGKAMVEFALKELEDYPILYLNAQVKVISFYEQFNFVGEGDIFFEANIPHQRMMYRKLDSD